MAQLGVPNDSVSRREALHLIEGIPLSENTVIVIDDYHLIDHVDIHNFIEVLVRKEIPNLHIVLVTRLILLENLAGYNDIIEMSRHHRKACELLTGPSKIIDTKGSWTFGSPSVLYLFYRESGQLEQEVQVIKETMPYYYQLTNGHGSGAESVMAAEWYFNRGEFENAELTGHNALYQASSKVQSGIMITAVFLQIRLAIIKSDFSHALYLFQKMREEINQKKLYMFMHTFELCEAFIYSNLKQKEQVPRWIARGEFQDTRLLFPAMPFVNIVYGRALLINGEFRRKL